jgi:hypothetical protein
MPDGLLNEGKRTLLDGHHPVNAECTRCASGFPRSCPCGGLIHAHFAQWCGSESAESFDFETICDVCGKFTTETIVIYDNTVFH